MITNYLILQALVHEINPILCGSSLQEAFSQQKNELILGFQSKDARAKEECNLSLYLSVDPKLNYFFLRGQVTRAKKNSVNLFSEIVDLRLDSIQLHPHDRTVIFNFQNKLFLNIQLYNTATSNIILTDDKKIINEAFKNNKTMKGTTFTVEEKNINVQLINDCNYFIDKLSEYSFKTVFAALKNIFPIWGSTYTREILHRARIDETTLIKDFDKHNLHHLHNEIVTFSENIKKYSPVIYYRDNLPKVLSIIELEHLSGSKAETFQSVNEAIRTFITKTFYLQEFESDKNTLLRKIKSELERLQHSFGISTEQVTTISRPEEYEHIGKVLMANLQHLIKGTKQIELPDIFNADRPLQILLDPKLTPVENAEVYFTKSKKAKIARLETEKRIEELKRKISLLEKLQLHLDQCHTTVQVREFKKEYLSDLKSMKLLKDTSTEERIPFRVFNVVGGYEVWVGKSSANNDLLTMKHAKPNDLWFHVRGASGSHTVLKVAGNKSAPSKESINQAASIAAYYSKMRNATNVPVAYCERKYVRKPKGTNSGTVFLEREKVIFVQPKLP